MALKQPRRLEIFAIKKNEASFPAEIHHSVKTAILARLGQMHLDEDHDGRCRGPQENSLREMTRFTFNLTTRERM